MKKRTFFRRSSSSSLVVFVNAVYRRFCRRFLFQVEKSSLANFVYTQRHTKKSKTTEYTNMFGTHANFTPFPHFTTSHTHTLTCTQKRQCMCFSRCVCFIISVLCQNVLSGFGISLQNETAKKNFIEANVWKQRAFVYSLLHHHTHTPPPSVCGAEAQLRAAHRLEECAFLVYPILHICIRTCSFVVLPVLCFAYHRKHLKCSHENVLSMFRVVGVGACCDYNIEFREPFVVVAHKEQHKCCWMRRFRKRNVR